jgi:ATP-dependent helicase/nuclease subunit A
MGARLNPGQREAVDSRAERVVVSAGAGSGKTRVLVQRFVDRVLEQEAAGNGSPLRSVLLITFTDKAAGELSERVRQTFSGVGRPDLAREIDGAWISTIHGFCARIVRRHALELGVDPGFSVLADPLSGIARTAAFERAATGCLGSPGLSAVIAESVEEGVADLRAMVLAAYDRARSKGVPIEAIGAARSAGYGSALSHLGETLRVLLPEYRRLRQTATVAANLAGFVRLEGETVRVAGIGTLPEGAEAAFALGGFRGACRGDEEMRTLTGRINGALQAVTQAAVGALASRRAEAYRALLVAFAREYEQAKARDGALDFEDLQLLARRLWAERPDIAERVGGQFVEIMVDEFQDTNPLQLEVIAPISRSAQCVVGDVQQSIYRFRDADVALLEAKLAAAGEAGDSQACHLTVNYRSQPSLLDGLNRIFGAPDFFGSDYLTLESGAGADGGATEGTGVRWPAGAPRVEALIVDKASCTEEPWRVVEARALARRMQEIVAAGRAGPGDIVVLVRASTTMPIYVDALREAGFDVVAASSGGFYATAEYADVRALLRVLANPLDDEGVLGLLAGGFGGLTDDALLLLARHGGERGLWRALGDAKAAGLAQEDHTRAALLRATIGRLRDARGHLHLADAILHAASVLGPGGGLLGRRDAWANVRKAVRLAAEFEREGASDPAAFQRYLDDRQTFVPREPAAGVAVEGSGAIRVMTVHAAKGLEFPVVAVADLGHEPVDRRPSLLLTGGETGLVIVARGPKAIGGAKADPSAAWEAAVEEERSLDLAEAKRVFYVACTRAQQALVLAGSTDPEGTPRAGIAADWVLQAARHGGSDLAPLLSIAIVGPQDLPDAPPLTREDRDIRANARGEAPAPHLREPVPIPVPREVSYTALALFERCAYRFFAERMLRVGSLALPKDDDPLAFGSALHAALELIARGEAVDDARLARIVDGRRLPDGSLARLVSAVTAVRASGVGPLLLQGRPEVPFAIRVSGGVVRGTMDLLVTGAENVMVLDYKTGATWDATGERYAAQAEIYALALLESGAASVLVRFVHVEAGCEEASYRFAASDRARVLERAEAAFARMRAGDFPPLRAYEPSLCADCPVSGGLCRVVHPGIRSRARGARPR